jgi:PadR family transcriptional regulator AphA
MSEQSASASSRAVRRPATRFASSSRKVAISTSSKRASGRSIHQLTQDGLVSVRAEAQDKRPDRKVYSITQTGRSQFLASLLKPLSEDRHRSPFVFAMLFSHLLPPERVSEMVSGYIRQSEEKMLQLDKTSATTAGERFAMGLGKAIYTAMIDFLRTHRGDIETVATPAAE